MVTYEDLTGEQKQAVDALDRNVALTAGAGTGKTTTLTARYVRMIERSIETATGAGDQDVEAVLGPENILTTTFTERAANELEESVRTEITERIDDVAVETFPAWRAVADDLEDGYIHTLHGFCARLLREHALTHDRLDPGFETLDENETTNLLDETVGAVLEEYETHEATRTLARRFSRTQLQDVLTDLLQERPDSTDWADRWADASEAEYVSFVETELHPIDPAVAAERLARPAVVDAIDTLQDIVADPPDIDTGGTAWTRAEAVVEVVDSNFDDGVPSREKQATIAALGRQLTTGSGDRYASYTGAKTRWGDHPRKDEFDGALEQLVEQIEPEQYAVDVDLDVEAASSQYVTSLAQLTQIAAREYEKRKQQQNVADFTDLLTAAVQFLADDQNEAVRRALAEQFEYVMIDEVQDTDPRQWELVELLTADDADDRQFAAENVFVVGDVKQSIYRFRNADVTKFEEETRRLEQISTSDQSSTAATDDQLSTNFRTVPAVLETINELFDAIFETGADRDPYEAPPQRLTADRDDPADVGDVEYLAVPTDPDLRARRFDGFEQFATADPDHDVELEAMALAARLSQVLTEPATVYPETDDTSEDDGESRPEPEPIEPSDVAILLRSRTHLPKYERAMEELNVPYSVASGVGFYESPEITALVNLLRALADPDDERALYGALRSPLFGFTDDALAQLTLEADSLWAALAASDRDRFAAVYDQLVAWRAAAGVGPEATADDRSWAAFLTRIVEETGYLVSISADERPRQAVENVEKFREQLRGWSDDVQSLPTLVDRIERRVASDGEEGEAQTTGDGVQILTIHDSKGMEFPFVVVPGLGRTFRDEGAIGSGAVEFERVGDQHAVGMKAPDPDDQFDTTDTIARQTLRERRRDEERAEEKRVLYVACTRARDRLLLTGLHDLADEAETPSMSELATADPEDADSWRDWVQPELLTDPVTSALETDDRVTVDYGAGEGQYTVSVPTPGTEIESTGGDVEPAVELSQAPPEPDVAAHISATELASLMGGYSDLVVDEATRSVSVVEREPSEWPDDGRVEADAIESDQEDRREASNEAAGAVEEVDRAVFGEMVHRLCELRPPREQWPKLMRQTMVEQGATVTLTEALQRRVSEHARRGIDYVDDQHAASNVQQVYDELYVTAEFDFGTVSGLVDHLFVTPEAYHVVDYKAGDVDPSEVESEAEYYLNQMKGYAVALDQQESERSVRVSLVFTAVDEAREVTWSETDLEDVRAEIEDAVGALFD